MIDNNEPVDPPVDPEEQRARARLKAVQLLARREHSGRELQRKLTRKGIERAVADEVIGQLGAKGLVSDERFAESFIRHRSMRGYGPVRIRAELAERGIDAQAIEQDLRDAGVDWNEAARQVRQRKFGSTLPPAFAARAKQGRFLQYRGFTAEQIRAALNVSDGPNDDVADDTD